MKTSGGKEILLVLLTLIRRRLKNGKIRISNRPQSETDEPEGDRACRKAKINYFQKTKSFVLLMYQTLLLYKVLRKTFF